MADAWEGWFTVAVICVAFGCLLWVGPRHSHTLHTRAIDRSANQS
jgi:hypothetical protein